MQDPKTLNVCRLCGRQDNGAAKCRDHPPLPANGRVLAKMVRVDDPTERVTRTMEVAGDE